MTEHDPLYDAARLQEIADLDLLSPEVDPILADVAALAAARLGLPVSLISVVLDEALHVAGAHGIDGLWLSETRGHPVEWSFCATVVTSGREHVLPDLAGHPVHGANPLVVVDGARSYAGVPLLVDGEIVGAHCVIGVAERAYTEADVEELRRGAVEITALLQRFRRHPDR